MQQIYPCLWFDNQSADAAKFYASLFKNSKIGHTAYFSKAGAEVSGQKEGTVLTVQLNIEGLDLIHVNGGPMFKHTPAFSLFVWCDSDQEIEALWKELSKSGEIRMGLDKYPFAKKYGWTKDRYGVEWQLIHREPGMGTPRKIVPAMLFANELFLKGEEAIKFYTSVFKDSGLDYAGKDPGDGHLQHSVFTLKGEKICLMEGPGAHDFKFSEAFSLMVQCKDQQELDHYWSKLSANPQSEMCGWLKDKYGVSWQIVPEQMQEWMTNPKTEGPVMDAIYKMKKIDIATLKKIADSVR